MEIESTRFSDYIWDVQAGLTTDELDPFTQNVYNSHYWIIDFKNVDKIQLWYNNLPAGKNVNCVIGPVKALPIIPITISNPIISIEGEKIEFPVTMESGMWLELTSDNNCKLYRLNGELHSKVKVKGIIHKLNSGNHNISFSCENKDKVSSRVKVTVISEGDLLINK